MSSNHVLAALTLLAVSLLLLALGLSSAGLQLPTPTWPALGLPASAPRPDGASGATSFGLDGPVAIQFALGFAAGWSVRWLYALPWSALPRAAVAWLLGWRRSMAMLSLAAGCTAVLLLY